MKVVRGLAAVGLAAAALAGAGCGDDETSQTVLAPPAPQPAPAPAPPAATQTTPPEPSTSTTEPPAEPSPPVATTGTPPDESPSSGDEEGNAVPKRLAVTARRVDPATLEVPAFLRVELTVVSADGRAHTVRIALPKGPLDIRVPPGGHTRSTLPGLKAGDYPVAVDGAAPAARIRATSGGPTP